MGAGQGLGAFEIPPGEEGGLREERKVLGLQRGSAIGGGQLRERRSPRVLPKGFAALFDCGQAGYH
jgi:hypothetical protein